MLHKTRGIVFKTTDYGENSIVTQVFTEKFGLQSFIVNGARKPGARVSKNMFQPLHLLDMVVYHNDSGNLQRIKELKNSPVLKTIPFDIVKSSIALFLNEVLYKSVRQQPAEEDLFDFLFSAIEWLDHQTVHIANFHLVFLVRLSRYLGFNPEESGSSDSDFFDLKNGVFARYKPDGLLYLSPPHTENFRALLRTGFDNLSSLKLNNDQRRYLIRKLLEYYALHIDGFGNIKSREILEEVLG